MQFSFNFIYCIFSFLSMMDIFSTILHNCTKFFFFFFLWISVHNYHLSVARTSVRTATMMMMMKYLKYTVKKLLVQTINFILFFLLNLYISYKLLIFNFKYSHILHHYLFYFPLFMFFYFYIFFIFQFFVFQFFAFKIFFFQFFVFQFFVFQFFVFHFFRIIEQFECKFFF